MSGQPYKYAADIAKFRQEYMDSLNLRTSIDDMNLQAVKAYKADGTLPAISQMKDTRTTSEILADIEKVKVQLLKDMEGLGTPNFAMAVLQRLERSPLNGDGSLFVFFAQRAPEIIKELKKGYRFGIVGDANDIETFVKNVEDMYNKVKGMTSSVKSYFNRPNVSMTTGIISEADLSKIIPMYREAARRLLLHYKDNLVVGYRIQAIADSLDRLYEIITSKNYDMLTRLFNAVTTRGQRVFSPQLTDQLFDIYKRISEDLAEIPKGETLLAVIAQLDKASKNQDPELVTKILDNFAGLVAPITELKDDFTEAQFVLTDNEAEIRAFIGGEPELFTGHGLPVMPKSTRGRGIKGCGLKLHEGEISTGIQPSQRYSTFGRYLINNNKLNDDIISIKRPSGGNIAEFPSSKVSSKLSRVFKKIVGGQLPSYNEMADLSEEEKNYLYKVSKKAEILDKLNIPAPSKDKEEKDIHQFEVMKGEIMAGNDSKELVKSFKALLMKLSKNGSLPKSQVSEVLSDLLEMGY